MATHYYFLTDDQNKIAAIIDIAAMANGHDDSVARALQEWAETYREENAELDSLVRAASTAFVRMYGEERLTGDDLPTSREDLMAAVRQVREIAEELNEAKAKLKGDPVRSSPRASEIDDRLIAASLRFVSGHDKARKAAKGL